jgi:hypothetical protein
MKRSLANVFRCYWHDADLKAARQLRPFLGAWSNLTKKRWEITPGFDMENTVVAGAEAPLAATFADCRSTDSYQLHQVRHQIPCSHAGGNSSSLHSDLC